MSKKGFCRLDMNVTQYKAGYDIITGAFISYKQNKQSLFIHDFNSEIKQKDKGDFMLLYWLYHTANYQCFS